MKVDLETLIAFADGELSSAERDEVQRAIDADPTLKAQLEAQRLLRARIAAAYDPIAKAPVPERLVNAVRAAPNVISLAARRPRWGVREWGAMAASLAAGLIVGVGLIRSPAVVATDSAGLVARAQLAHALDTQLAADTAQPVRIGLTFRNRSGDFCRTFAMASMQTQGLACRDGRQWRLEMMTRDRPTPESEIRIAASAIDPGVLDAAQGMMAGPVLDASGERRARDAEWRESPQ